ncbi:DNA gyrase inhibitor YacG [Legionella fallonii]|uniref:DNA gyrase inhibitor YacG n=1 Tax=Legionella fallonii LLAP-10 TaxID=1212491 RepID=A0A098G468_9GAMM|nr:DNA gyrase inhibitor YacG [Legionella fallonii]CEG57283.1 DNA gyrase inhibitor YacG [Legionella fallonii LLAP-10]
MNNQKRITCPTCGKENTWHPENLFRPFCSDRCKLIDLGEWASDTRKIPGNSIDPELAVAIHIQSNEPPNKK